MFKNIIQHAFVYSFLISVVAFILLINNRIVTAEVIDYPITTNYNDITTYSQIKNNFGVSGNAEINNPLIRLTYDRQSQVGSAYLKNKIQLTDDFYVEGFLRIGLHRSSRPDADGISISFHSGNVDALGEKGSGLGVENLPNAISLVLRTYRGSGEPEVPYAGVWTTNSKGQKSVIKNMPLYYPGDKYEDFQYSFSYTAASRKIIMKFRDSKGDALGESGYSYTIPDEMEEYSFAITGSTGFYSNEQEAKISLARVAQLKTNKPKVVKELVENTSVKLTLTDENGISYPEGSIVYIGNDTTGSTVDSTSSITIKDANQYTGPLSIKVKSYKINKTNKLWGENSEATTYTLAKPMELVTTPTEMSVYDNYKEDFVANYILSKIPSETTTGFISFTYPNATTDKMTFASNNEKTYKGSQVVPRTSIPENLNSIPGTIVEYDTKLKAIITEGNFNEGLSSNEQLFKVKVYNLGAKTVAQTVKKDSTWNKKPESLIKDPVILPGHVAKYEYVSTSNPPVDTSKEGLQYVEVRMTDTTEPTQVKIIKVPVMVVNGNIPTTGIVVAAKNIESKSEPFKNLTEEQRKDKIVELSEASAWDASTGLNEGINLFVENTTLPSNPVSGTTYNATLKAQKGNSVSEKKILIKILDNQLVKVTFLDKLGQSLNDQVTLTRPIGSTIDLTKEENIQNIIKSIENRNYQLTDKPDKESEIIVESNERTVTYKFSGTLKIQSSPDYLSFGRRRLNVPFIKVEKATYNKPLVIWDNREISQPWHLMATLKQPLTLENSTVTLPSALKYKLSEEKTITLSLNNTQELALRTNSQKGEYILSNEWNAGTSGFQLEIPAKQVVEEGKYRATILWSLVSAP